MNTSITTYDLIVVGAGVGGIAAVESALSHGDSRTILLINEEEWAPYDRPPLSKEMLLADAEAGEFDLLGTEARNAAGLRILDGTRAVRIDRASRTLTLSDDSTVGYRSLILATGSVARRLAPAVVGAAPAGRIFYLRTRDDALALRRTLTSPAPPRLIIVGAGFIGLEVAAAARRLGCATTIVEAAAGAVGRSAPAPVAELLQARHACEGVAFHFRTQATAIRPAGDGLEIELDDGRSLAADVVVAGMGTTPNDALARDAGLACDNGILVGEDCRTSDPAIYAVGDVARLAADGMPRMEHWQAARSMGRVAALNACGEQERHQEIPWVWTDQYDLNIQFIGHTSARSRLLTRGDISRGKGIVFEKTGDTLTAATLVNTGRDRRTVERLIARGLPVADDALLDPAIELKSLLR